MKINPLLVQNAKLSSKITPYDDVISAFDEVIDYVGKNFIHISGDSNIGLLHLSSALIVGNENRAIDKSAVIHGYNNSVGAYGYKILSQKYFPSSSNPISAILSIDGNIDTRINSLKPSFSSASRNATTSIGKVLSADIENSTLSVLVKRTLGSELLYFEHYPYIGNKIIYDNTYSLATGRDNAAIGYDAYSEGLGNVAAGNHAHCEGTINVASWGSHAEGATNRALSEASHVEGRVNTIRLTAPFSHAEGTNNIAENVASHAAGYMARAKDKLSFVWNGLIMYGYLGNPTAQFDPISCCLISLPDTEIPIEDYNARAQEYMDSDMVLSAMYQSNGQGTFNINPLGGINGFYIGLSSLSDYLAASSKNKPLSGMTYTIETNLSTMLHDILSVLGATVNF